MQLPVLMYHKVSENKWDALTVTTQQLEQQLCYVVSKGYQFLSTNDLLNYMENKKPLPLKPILITFDDAHISFIESALPIFKKLNMSKITLFVPSGLVGSNHQDCGEIMSVEQIKNLDFNIVEPALHSHQHQNYKFLSTEEINQDLQKQDLTKIFLLIKFIFYRIFFKLFKILLFQYLIQNLANFFGFS